MAFDHRFHAVSHPDNVTFEFPAGKFKRGEFPIPDNASNLSLSACHDTAHFRWTVHPTLELRH